MYTCRKAYRLRLHHPSLGTFSGPCRLTPAAKKTGYLTQPAHNFFGRDGTRRAINQIISELSPLNYQHNLSLVNLR